MSHAHNISSSQSGQIESLLVAERLVPPFNGGVSVLPSELEGGGGVDSLPHRIEHAHTSPASHICAQPDLHTLVEKLASGAYARVQREVGVGAVRYTALPCFERGDLFIRQVDAVGHHGLVCQQAVFVVHICVGRAVRVERTNPLNLFLVFCQVRLNRQIIGHCLFAQPCHQLAGAGWYKTRRDDRRDEMVVSRQNLLQEQLAVLQALLRRFAVELGGVPVHTHLAHTSPLPCCLHCITQHKGGRRVDSSEVAAGSGSSLYMALDGFRVGSLGEIQIFEFVLCREGVCLEPLKQRDTPTPNKAILRSMCVRINEPWDQEPFP
mmetsp:Transcript_25837/g.50909  ORF Transcript_25837/g.50909 Transcript_25837/m.50909 type:complete len:322 (-) Transcript_25837:507-1472(-)